MSQKKSTATNNKSSKILSIFLKLLALFLLLFGIRMGKGKNSGEELNDEFIKNPKNKELVKSKAREMIAHKLGKPLLNLGLKIPAVRNYVKNHLSNNPDLKELAKEVINEDEQLSKELSQNNNFLKDFSDLLPENLQPTKEKLQQAKESPETEDFTDDLNNIKDILENKISKNIHDPNLNNELSDTVQDIKNYNDPMNLSPARNSLVSHDVVKNHVSTSKQVHSNTLEEIKINRKLNIDEDNLPKNN